jgi:hypothetical protein
MTVEKLTVTSSDKGSKEEGERRMMTPWRGRIVAGKHSHYYYFLLL